MNDIDPEIFILKMDIVAAGTLLRVGRGAQDFCPVELLSIGDDVFDPVEDRLVEIAEMSCLTLDDDTIRDRGYSPKRLDSEGGASALVYAVKVPTLLARHGYTPPIRREYKLPEGTVFYALSFERRTILQSPSCLCEFVRPSPYTIQTTPQRSAAPLAALIDEGR